MRLARLLLFLLALVPGGIAGAEPGPATAASAAGGASAPVVAYLKVEEVIDDFQLRYIERSLAEAKAKGATVIVTHIVSDGGYLHIAEEIVHKLLAIGDGGPRLIAFIDRKAWSAAAMIAYAHHEVHLAPTGKIGDIGVIFQSGDSSEPIKYAPEKIETAVRAMLRSIAQARGWDEANLVKMTARNQELYRFTLPAADGKPARTVNVIEDQLPAFLAQHPDVDPNSKVLIAGKDRLISYTAQEAVAEGMATAMTSSLDALYERIGARPGDGFDLSRTQNERIAATLGSWAPLLAAATILLIIVEMKMGSGLFILLAAITGAGFLFCQYYLDLASAIDIVLMLVGASMILVELFILPTGGIIAGLGGLLAMAGLFLAFMPNLGQFDVTAPDWGGQALVAFEQALLSLALFVVAALVLIASAPRLGLFRRVAVQAEIGGTSDAPALSGGGLVGRRAIARSDLRPSGFIVLGPGERAGEELSATAEHGVALAAGTPVVVVSVQLGEAVVRKAEA